MNGCIETVTEIVYDDPREQNIQGSLPLFVVANFLHCTIEKF